MDKKLRVGSIGTDEEFLVPPPAANKIHKTSTIILHNADSVERTVQIDLYYDGTAYRMGNETVGAGRTVILGSDIVIALDGARRYIAASLTETPGTEMTFIATYDEQDVLGGEL